MRRGGRSSTGYSSHNPRGRVDAPDQAVGVVREEHISIRIGDGIAWAGQHNIRTHAAISIDIGGCIRSSRRARLADGIRRDGAIPRNELRHIRQELRSRLGMSNASDRCKGKSTRQNGLKAPYEDMVAEQR